MLSKIVEFMGILALFFGLYFGRMDSLAASVAQSPGQALEVLLGMAGSVCFWSGMMEVMEESGLAGRLGHLLRAPIGWIYGRLGGDRQAVALLARNMAGNLLGLGSAATPAGLEGAARLQTLWEQGRVGRRPLCLLAVVNTVSIQMIPTTVAAGRKALGAAAPYDILLPVWCASICSLLAALLAARVLLEEEIR